MDSLSPCNYLLNMPTLYYVPISIGMDRTGDESRLVVVFFVKEAALCLWLRLCVDEPFVQSNPHRLMLCVHVR